MTRQPPDLEPTTLADDDLTPTETPLAKAIREALCGPMARLRHEMAQAARELEGRLCESLVNSVSPRLLEIETDVSALKAELESVKLRLDTLERRDAVGAE